MWKDCVVYSAVLRGITVLPMAFLVYQTRTHKIPELVVKHRISWLFATSASTLEQVTVGFGAFVPTVIVRSLYIGAAYIGVLYILEFLAMSMCKIASIPMPKWGSNYLRFLRAVSPIVVMCGRTSQAFIPTVRMEQIASVFLSTLTLFITPPMTFAYLRVACILRKSSRSMRDRSTSINSGNNDAARTMRRSMWQAILAGTVLGVLSLSLVNSVAMIAAEIAAGVGGNGEQVQFQSCVDGDWVRIITLPVWNLLNFVLGFRRNAPRKSHHTSVGSVILSKFGGGGGGGTREGSLTSQIRLSILSQYKRRGSTVANSQASRSSVNIVPAAANDTATRNQKTRSNGSTVKLTHRSPASQRSAKAPAQTATVVSNNATGSPRKN